MPVVAVAAGLGARIGLDDAGVNESRALGGDVLSVGKYLSPKLYVGYGVSLLGTGQVMTLKYLLRKELDISGRIIHHRKPGIAELAQGKIAPQQPEQDA